MVKRKRNLPLSRVYRLLEPGPMVLVTTAHAGRTNVMTMSWTTMIDFEPPIIGCVMSERNFSFELLQASKECVLNIPTARARAQVVGCGNCSGRRLDKFAAFHLTPLPASRVSAPLIGECCASLECKVIDSRMASQYNFFVLEVVKAWRAAPSQAPLRTLHHRGRGTFMVAGRELTLPSKKK